MFGRHAVKVEERGAAAAAWAQGVSHHRYEDRSRLLAPLGERPLKSRGGPWMLGRGLTGGCAGIDLERAVFPAPLRKRLVTAQGGARPPERPFAPGVLPGPLEG